MEIDIQFLWPILLSFCVLALTKLWLKSSASKLPPGPPKLPIIGNLHLLALGGSAPHHLLRDLAGKYGPLMHLQLGEVSNIIVSSPHYAREFMITHGITFASRPEILATKILSYNCKDIIFAPYGDYWRQVRKLCVVELLSTKRVLSFRAVRYEEKERLIELICSRAGSPINLSQIIVSSSYATTSRAAFGTKSKHQEQVILAIKEASEAATGFSLADLYPSMSFLYVLTGMKAKLERLHKQTDQFLDDIVNEHRKDKAAKVEAGIDASKDEDLVDVLLNFEGFGNSELSLSTESIKAIILDVFGAGSETSATLVIWAMAEMMKNPRVMEKAQAEVRNVFNEKGNVDETAFIELDYLKLVIKETLRFHPPTPLLVPRECGQKFEINGFEIPEKTRLMVNAWAIGRDPEYWIEAETFYPERFIGNHLDYGGTHFEYIPFGAGRRVCPGIAFGMANIENLLALLLYHFDWKLPNGKRHEDLDMTEAFGLTVQKKEDLYLIPIPYRP